MGVRRLPVLATVLSGWRLLACDWLALLGIVALPLAILVALDVYLASLWWDYLDSLSVATSDYVAEALSNMTVLDRLVALVFGGLVVALWHRVRVAGPRTLSPFSLLAAWRNIVALTVLWSGLLLVTVGVIWVFDFLMLTLLEDSIDQLLLVRFDLADNAVLYRVLSDLVLQGVPLLLTLHIVGRLGLMLWARSAGGADALDKAWTAGTGNGWRIAAAIFLAVLPIEIVASGLEATRIDRGILYMFLSFDLSNTLRLVVAAAVIAAAHAVLLGNGKASETHVPADPASV